MTTFPSEVYHGAVKLGGQGLLGDDLRVSSRDQTVNLKLDAGLADDRGLLGVSLDLTPDQCEQLRELLEAAERAVRPWPRAG